MDAEKLEEYAPLIVAGVLVLGAIYLYSNASASASSIVVPGVDAVPAQTAAANANAAISTAEAANNANVFSELTQLAATEYNNETSITLGAQTYATAVGQQAVEAQAVAAQLQAAQAAANAQIQQANATASAQKSSSFWGGLTSLFSSALPFFSGTFGGGGLSVPTNASFPNSVYSIPTPNFSATSFPLPVYTPTSVGSGYGSNG